MQAVLTVIPKNEGHRVLTKSVSCAFSKT